jgi:penicillin V acylase-like amidase (Ntn superfamily)
MCTGITLKTKDGSIVHGRTVEFDMTIDTTIAVIMRGNEFTGQTPRGDGLKYTAKYAVVGVIAFTDVKILDGEMPASGGPSSLFIDTIGRPLSPVSVAGVHRR